MPKVIRPMEPWMDNVEGGLDVLTSAWETYVRARSQYYLVNGFYNVTRRHNLKRGQIPPQIDADFIVLRSAYMKALAALKKAHIYYKGTMRHAIQYRKL